MTFEHGQDRAHKGHLSESLRNAIRDEISWLKSLRIKIEFERAFLTRLTYAFQDAPPCPSKTAPNNFRSSSKCRSAASRL